VHIEQGPVLNELDLPLGVVTSINGSVRYLGEVTGQASHAGTTPMDRRRDAACAVAELALYVESAPAPCPTWWARWACCKVPAGSINVVPGRCQFSLDLRATTNAARDALAADVRAELARICERRGLTSRWKKRWRRRRAQRTRLAAALGSRRGRAGPAGAPHAQRRRARRDEAARV
jgi:N-carbamoyl-L-amino-acid hydrolase